MKRKMKNMSVVLIMFGILSLAAISASAQAQQDFTLINNTGVEIYALYVTPSNAKDWGGDILGADTLPVGETLDITFARKEKAKFWDLRIEDADGAFIEWTNLDLLKIDTLTLYYKNGKATATFTEKNWDLAGTWVGYYEDGTKSPYVWAITQKGNTISIRDAKGGKARSSGSVQGSEVFARDFATQNGVVSEDGMRIIWSDGVVWKRQ